MRGDLNRPDGRRSGERKAKRQQSGRLEFRLARKDVVRPARMLCGRTVWRRRRGPVLPAARAVMNRWRAARAADAALPPRRAPRPPGGGSSGRRADRQNARARVFSRVLLADSARKTGNPGCAQRANEGPDRRLYGQEGPDCSASGANAQHLAAIVSFSVPISDGGTATNRPKREQPLFRGRARLAGAAVGALDVSREKYRQAVGVLPRNLELLPLPPPVASLEEATRIGLQRNPRTSRRSLPSARRSTTSTARSPRRGYRSGSASAAASRETTPGR